MMGWYGNGWGSGVGMLVMLLVWGGLIAPGRVGRRPADPRRGAAPAR